MTSQSFDDMVSNSVSFTQKEEILGVLKSFWMHVGTVLAASEVTKLGVGVILWPTSSNLDTILECCLVDSVIPAKT